MTPFRLMGAASVVVATMFFQGCSEGTTDCTPGSEGCVCSEGLCLTGLVCLSNICVDDGGGGGTGGDGGSGGTAATGGDGGSGGSLNGSCDPLMQQGCQLDEKCSARLGVGSIPSTTECLPDGTQSLGESCEIAVDAEDPNMTRFDNCAAGGFCDDDECRELCDPEADGVCAGACVTLSGVFGDGVGVCTPQCDPLDDTSCEVGEGCYLVPLGSEFLCALPAAGAEDLVAWDECEPVNADDECFINSGPVGSSVGYPLDWTPQAFRGVVSPWCAPVSTHSLVAGRLTTRHGNAAIRACGAQNLQSVSDFGVEGTRPGECRFVQSIFLNEEFGLVPETIGVCVNPAEGPNWKLAADFDLAAYGANPSDPSFWCPGCVTRAELAQARAMSAADGTEAPSQKQFHLSEEGLRRFERMMGVTFDDLRRANEGDRPIEIPGFHGGARATD